MRELDRPLAKRDARRGTLHLLGLALSLVLHVPGNAANTFFDLPTEILSGPGSAMFVHNLLRCWVDTHQRSSQSLVQDRLRLSEAEPRFKSGPELLPWGFGKGPPIIQPSSAARLVGQLACSTLPCPSCRELEAVSPVVPRPACVPSSP